MFRWTESGKVVLGTLPDDASSRPTSITGDGATIAGYSCPTRNLRAECTAITWDEQNGIRSLRDLLVQQHGLGTSLSGWTLHDAHISADGSTFAGWGTNPSGNFEAWVARLPLATTPPIVTLVVDPLTIGEGGGVATATAALSHPATEDVTISLGFSGSATAGSDYTVSQSQILVPRGAAEGAITITSIDDSIDEADESVVVEITSVINGIESGEQQQSVTLIDDDEPTGLTVTSIVATSSGFVTEFSHELDMSSINLYATETFGSADVTLTGETVGPVSGSLVIGDDSRTVIFVKSGGPLVPDKYTVMLRSDDDGFKDADGRLLDGNGDGTAGDSFIDTFTLAPPAADPITVGISDFVRGPGQDVNLPATESLGIPLSISDGTDVKAIDLQISYDPTLLEITGATVAAGMPPGASVTANTTTPGRLILVFFSATALPAGSSEFVHLQARVPATNPDGIYGKQQVLDVHSVTISDGNDNEFPVIVDDAVHLVSYLADVSGNRRINASDAAQVARVAALIDDGFGASPLTDPRMVGDISGNGRINAADASLVARFAALIPVPEIPLLPAGTAANAALRLAAPQVTPAGDDKAVDSTATASAGASVADYWQHTAFQNQAYVVLHDWPAEGLKSDDSGTLEDAIDEFFAALDELKRQSL